MNLTLYLKELRRNSRGFVIWATVLVMLVLFTLYAIPSLVQSNASLKTLFSMYPESVKRAFNIDLERLTNILGLYLTYQEFYLLLSGSIYAITLGMSIISKEEASKSADFLLTRPISRTEVVASKTAAFLTHVLLLDAVVSFSGWLGMVVFSNQQFSLHAFLIYSAYGTMLTLLFGSLGLFISVLGHRGRGLTGAGIGIVLAGYIIMSLSSAIKKVEYVGYASPFWFVDRDVLAADYGFVWWRVAYFLILSATFIALTFLVYRKKDIYL